MKKKSTKFIKPSWQDIEKYCVSIATSIKEVDIKYDCIISVGRGGMIPARILSELLNIKDIYLYNIHCYNDSNIADKVYTEPFNYELLKNKKILIVDDVYTTGNTLDYVTNDIFSHTEEVFLTTSTLFENTQQLIIERQPDFYADTYDSQTSWIVFPWEKVIERMNDSK